MLGINDELQNRALEKKAGTKLKVQYIESVRGLDTIYHILSVGSCQYEVKGKRVKMGQTELKI